MIQKQIKDENLRQYLLTLDDDMRYTYLSSSKNIRVIVCKSTKLVNNAIANHDYGILESYIAARALSAGALFTIQSASYETINFKLECQGPIQGFSIDILSGNVLRGYIFANPIKYDEKKQSNLDALFGPGFITVTKKLANSEPFIGQTMMEHGSIEKDLTLYFYQSEQIPSIIAFDSELNENNKISSCSSIMIQALPSISEEEIEKLERVGKKEDAFKFSSLRKDDLTKYLSTLLDENLTLLEESKLMYYCPCEKDHVRAFAESEIKDDNDITLTCLNCNTTYLFTKEELSRNR